MFTPRASGQRLREHVVFRSKQLARPRGADGPGCQVGFMAQNTRDTSATVWRSDMLA